MAVPKIHYKIKNENHEAQKFGVRSPKLYTKEQPFVSYRPKPFTTRNRSSQIAGQEREPADQTTKEASSARSLASATVGRRRGGGWSPGRRGHAGDGRYMSSSGAAGGEPSNHI